LNFADRLAAAVEAKGAPIVVGLDPHLERLPEEFAAARDPNATRADRAGAVAEFLCGVIDVIAEHAPAVKPQSAFFEVLGPDGTAAWERVVSHAHAAELLVIGDVKRGDIGSTAAAYAQAFLTGIPGTPAASLCDAITVNPYLGSDSIAPFLEACRAHDKGLFVLLRTSNPSSAEFQEHGDPTLVDRVARAIDGWGEELLGEHGTSSVGAVVGATHPDELARLRALLPRTPFLIPGYGAQGGGARDVVGAFGASSAGGLVNSSRGILFPAPRSGEDWRAATRRAVLDMAQELRAALGR
jgi:orotidine-5'-phosphate decarboxylase